MTYIRITKQFNFEAAHALWNYDGKCKNIHGHTYKLFVTVKGCPISDTSNPKLGMVMDFGDLKRIVNDNIVNVYDHTLCLNREAEKKFNFPKDNQMFQRYIVTDYQPTSENMLIEFVKILKTHLPNDIDLCRVRLYETETSYAERLASDND